MNEQHVLTNIENWVKEKLQFEKSGHDWYHIYRVTELAKEILKHEEANEFIVTAASLLHDIPDDKVTDNVEASIEEIKILLNNNDVTPHDIETIVEL